MLDPSLRLSNDDTPELGGDSSATFEEEDSMTNPLKESCGHQSALRATCKFDLTTCYVQL